MSFGADVSLPKENSPQTFEAFWTFYLSQHQNPVNRALHFGGTTGALFCLALALLGRRPLLLLAPLLGYGPAWAGHFLLERNRPATFEQPLWSLRADLRMWWRTVQGISMQPATNGSD